MAFRPWAETSDEPHSATRSAVRETDTEFDLQARHLALPDRCCRPTAPAAQAASAGWRLPSIQLVTTLALLVAQLPVAARMTLAKPLGIRAMYLFLAAVRGSADVATLLHAGALDLSLFAFICSVPLVHGLVVVVYRLQIRSDADIIAIASTANIGGATSAFALAESVGRRDLVPPGILAAPLGTALGSCVVLASAGMLRDLPEGSCTRAACSPPAGPRLQRPGKTEDYVGTGPVPRFGVLAAT